MIQCVFYEGHRQPLKDLELPHYIWGSHIAQNINYHDGFYEENARYVGLSQ